MNTNPKKQRIVFCDFDGTITKQETFVAMLSRFVPDKMKEFGRKLSQKQVTLREGVKGVVESIPSRDYPAVVEFIKDREIREGFYDFLLFLKAEEVPFVVISGGLRDSVKTRLAPFSDYIAGIFAPEIDSSGEYLRVVSAFEEGDELLAKVRVMELFKFEESIVIGDGITDHKIALASSVVLARDRLAQFMKQADREYILWDDFNDIREILQNLWHKTEKDDKVGNPSP
ncbi:MAG: HAD-IB family phosphatase [Desulfobacteraceae bacterium]|nr:HAD-IB family phosphatase [Desulfobacteraceae bacterium]MBU4053633.1 HAD-IB family phosphatase [Pseudomonadota bacterium]